MPIFLLPKPTLQDFAGAFVALFPVSAEQPKGFFASLVKTKTLNEPKGPRHTKNSTRSEFTICSEFTTRSDSLLKM